MIFLQLFYTFFKIGLFGFGGGYAMLSMIQGEVVTRYGWLTAQEFTDIVAISQMTPGPIGINSATYVGYSTVVEAGYGMAWGIVGSCIATFAVVLPSFILMLTISKFFIKYQKHPAVEAVFSGLRPAVVGLLASAALVLMAHASNYVMPWRAAWNTWSTVLPFFGYAALIGVATMGLVGAVHGYALDRRVSLAAGGFAVFGLALYLVIVGRTDAVEPTASRVLTGDLATWFWGLTVGAGVVLPWGLTLLARQSRVALTAALFAALVGCAGWQIVVLRLGSAAWSFFAR